MSRLYQPIWEALKSMPLDQAKSKGVSVSATRTKHKRIVKAVKKEKWLDLGYKILTDPQKMMLTHESKGAILTFYLSVAPHTIDSSCL